LTLMIEIAARVFRGSAVEAIHYAGIAVVGVDGRLTHYLGDPELVTMTRSSIKPFQVVPMILSGAADHFRFSPRQLAIMCGSHNGTDEHRETVLANLAAAGNRPEDLRCGAHVPLFLQWNNQYPRHDEDKDPVRHNCSGKHSGFLAQAVFLGEDKTHYLDAQSRTQTLVKEVLSRIAEYPPDKMPVGVDGCSAPNYPLPLKNLALAFKKLANAEAEGDHDLRAALTRVKGAMCSHPEMTSGEKRFDRDLMRSFPGNAVCKVGAEGLEGIGFYDPPLGIAVKIHDGNRRALAAVCVEVLKQLGIVRDMDNLPHLRIYEKPEITNDRNIVTGHVVPEFTLHRV
jgi:L-asparaginase II